MCCPSKELGKGCLGQLSKECILNVEFQTLWLWIKKVVWCLALTALPTDPRFTLGSDLKGPRCSSQPGPTALRAQFPV